MIQAFLVLFFAFALSKEACCLPDAWEGLANGWDRRGNASFFEMVSYDFKMEALRVDRFENFRDSNHRHHSSFFVLRDRRDNRLKEYWYDRAKDSCTAKTATGPFKKLCVLENHHQEFKFTLGVGYRVVYYGYDHKDFKGQIVVSEVGCAPISGTFFDHHKVFEQTNYFDVKLGIGNPIVFELPTACL